MVDTCKLDFDKALGEQLSADDRNALWEKLNEEIKYRQKSLKEGNLEAINNALKTMKDMEERVAMIAKRDAMMNAIKSKELDKTIGSFNNHVEGMEANLLGLRADVAGALSNSTELQIKQSMAAWFNKLVENLTRGEVLDVFTDSTQARDIAYYLWNRTLPEGHTITNKNAKTVSDIIYELQEGLRKSQNDAGADIGELNNYLTSQSHNPERLLETADTFNERMAIRYQAMKDSRGNFSEARTKLNELAYQRWKNATLPRLDMEQSFRGALDDETKVDEILRGSWEGLVSGQHGRLSSGQNEGDIFGLERTSNLARKAGAERKLIFKDSNAWMDNNDQYGFGSLATSITSNVKRGAANIALMNKWGTNPRAMFQRKLKKVLHDYSRKDFANKRKITSISKRFNAYFDMLDGTNSIPVNSLGARTGRALRLQQSLSKLGLILPASLADLAVRTEVFREHGENLLGEYYNAFSGVLTGRPTGEQKMIANSFGVWADTTLGHMAAESAPWQTPQGFTAKGSAMFFKLTGIEWLDETNRLSIASGLSNLLAGQKDIAFAELRGETPTILKMYGIQESEWDLIRTNSNIWKEAGGKQFITPDAALGFTDKSVARYLGIDAEDLKPKQLEAVRQDMHNRLMMFFIDRTNDGNLRPGIRSQYFWQRGTQAGTWEGEFLRFVSQFKAYPTEFISRVLGRKVFGIKVDTPYGLKAGSVDVQGLLNVMIGSTILGYVGMQSKNILKNKSLRDPTHLGTWLAALLQGGGLGIYGDFIFGEYNRFGHKFTDAIAGPSIGFMNDVAALAFTLKKLDDPRAQTLQLLKNNTPFINLWFLRGGLDFLFFNGIQEQLNPGYTQRASDRMMKQNDQSFMINPLAFDITGAR